MCLSAAGLVRWWSQPPCRQVFCTENRALLSPLDPLVVNHAMWCATHAALFMPCCCSLEESTCEGLGVMACENLPGMKMEAGFKAKMSNNHNTKLSNELEITVGLCHATPLGFVPMMAAWLVVHVLHAHATPPCNEISLWQDPGLSSPCPYVHLCLTVLDRS